MLIVGVGLGLALALGAGFVIHVLTTGKAGPAADVLRIQSLAVVTQFVGSAGGYALLALHRYRSMLLITGAGLIVSVCLTLVLVPVFQSRGAATAFAAGEATVAILTFAMLRVARADITFSLRVPVRVLLAAVLAGAVVLIPGLTSLAQAVIASSVYLGVLVASGAVPPELAQALLRRRQSLTP
jgi:O-antigen/teichoic acid export membrane protein